MFKLVKILNGRINQPEPMALPLTAGATPVTVKRGSLLTVKNGVLANCAATDKPMYFCAHSTTLAAGETAEIPVFLLSPDMVFETTVAYSDTPKALALGGLYTLAQTTYDSENGLSYASGMTDVSTGGVVRVFDLSRPDGDGKKIWVTIPQ